MATSTTVIAALKYRGGVIIAADSQASDLVARVRWPVEKLERVGNHAFVLGFSGSVGMAQRARAVLNSTSLHPNTFKKRDLIRDVVDRCFRPVYEMIRQHSYPPTATVSDIGLWGVAAFWAENAPQILEYELYGDSSFHDYFHAIGSASATAYAIYRTLGGRRLTDLQEPKAILAMLRILRTCVDVELWGVSEPLGVWTVSDQKTRKLSAPEIDTNMQLVSRWEEQERTALFST